MNRKEANRFKRLEDSVKELRKANRCSTLRQNIIDRNRNLIQMYMNDIYDTLEEESEKQMKPIGNDGVYIES